MPERDQWDLYLEDRFLRLRGACWSCRLRIIGWWLWQASFGPRRYRRMRRILMLGAWQERKRLRALNVPHEWIHERRWR